MAARVIAAPALRAHCERILQAAGSAPAEARTVAANLVLANLSGHDSHGVGMLPRYVDAVLEGGLTPNTGVRIHLDIGTLLALDGQQGFGQVVGEQAMNLGIERARQHGSCIMTLAHAHHIGRIGHWAEMAVQAGLVSLHFVNVQAHPAVAPWGGADARFGTNPCCIGIPVAGQPPFVLDFATSRVAQGKMRVAHNEGRQVELGHVIDPDGRPTTDPGVVVVPQTPGARGNLLGALLSFGEHKGYGLATACELLGGALTGMGTWHRKHEGVRAVYNGMLTILIDPARLGPRETFDRETVAFIDWLRSAPPAQGVDAVQVAGDPERAARVQREREGIWIDASTWGEITQAAVKVHAPTEP
jgi:uncharacterized oxidoreductase